MARGFKPVKSTGSDNLFVAGHRDPVLRKYLGKAVIDKLAGKPAGPRDNSEAAAQYIARQQKSKTSKARS